jgi:hypothetical protein
MDSSVAKKAQQGSFVWRRIVLWSEEDPRAIDEVRVVAIEREA